MTILFNLPISLLFFFLCSVPLNYGLKPFTEQLKLLESSEKVDVRTIKEKKLDFTKYHPIYEISFTESFLTSTNACRALNSENNITCVDFQEFKDRGDIIDFAVVSERIYALSTLLEVWVYSYTNEKLIEIGKLDFLELMPLISEEKDVFLRDFNQNLLFITNNRFLTIDLQKKNVFSLQNYSPKTSIHAVVTFFSSVFMAIGSQGVSIYFANKEFYNSITILNKEQKLIDIRDIIIVNDSLMLAIDYTLGIQVLQKGVSTWSVARIIELPRAEKAILYEGRYRNSLLLVSEVSNSTFTLIEILSDRSFEVLKENKRVFMEGRVNALMAANHFALGFTSNGLITPILGVDSFLKKNFFVNSGIPDHEYFHSFHQVTKGKLANYHEKEGYNIVLAVEKNKLMILKTMTAYTEILCREDPAKEPFFFSEFMIDLKTLYSDYKDQQIEYAWKEASNVHIIKFLYVYGSKDPHPLIANIEYLEESENEFTLKEQLLEVSPSLFLFCFLLIMFGILLKLLILFQKRLSAN